MCPRFFGLFCTLLCLLVVKHGPTASFSSFKLKGLFGGILVLGAGGQLLVEKMV